MINFNGECFNNLKSVPEELLLHLDSLPIHVNHIIAINGKISLLESHYFSIMASLRRFRVKIPMYYTLNFFQEQTDNLSKLEDNKEELKKITIKFYRTHNPAPNSPVTSICFLMQIDELYMGGKDINLTLYKDYYLFADEFSNLFQTNESLRKLGQVFAYENGFRASLLLNHHKRLAESTHGAVFLIREEGIHTPALSEGGVNSVIRHALIEFLNNKNKASVIETEIPTFSIQQSQEIFLISVEYGWTNVDQFRRKVFEKKESEIIRKEFLDNLKNQL